MRRLNSDRGAVGVFTAITIVVLLGAVGLTIDVGALYRERRELRNGADAGALSIAEDCALGLSTCNTGQARAIAADYANANASDGFADVIGVDLDLSAKTVRAVGTSSRSLRGWWGSTARRCMPPPRLAGDTRVSCGCICR
jgi:Flp pilus assembly protein TadG